MVIEAGAAIRFGQWVLFSSALFRSCSCFVLVLVLGLGLVLVLVFVFVFVLFQFLHKNDHNNNTMNRRRWPPSPLLPHASRFGRHNPPGTPTCCTRFACTIRPMHAMKHSVYILEMNFVLWACIGSAS